MILLHWRSSVGQGSEIRADFDGQTIVMYQAYAPAIADPAVKAGRSSLRMCLPSAAYATGLCGLVVPLLAAPWPLAGWDAALAFAAVSWLYYPAYELVHLAAHLRVDGPWDRMPGSGGCPATTAAASTRGR